MKLAVLAVLTVAAFGQIPPKQDAVVTLANMPSADSAKQMTTIVKTVGDVLDVSFDETHSSFALRGRANELGLAEWLLHTMDKPAGWAPSMQDAENPSAREYHMQKGFPINEPWPIARVYYVQNTTSQLGMQEILTTMRVVGDFAKAFECSLPRMMAFRGNATMVDLGEWMIRKLDVPAGSQNSSPDVFNLPNKPDGSEDVVKVFYLEPTISPQALNDLSKKIRSTAKIQRVFQFTSPPAITARGSSAMLVQAQQIIASR